MPGLHVAKLRHEAVLRTCRAVVFSLLVTGGGGCVAARSSTASPTQPTAPHDPAATAAALVQAHVARHWPQRQPWRWDAAVLYLGVARLAQVDTPRRAVYLDILRRYHARHAEHRGPDVRMPDHCPSARSALILAELSPGTDVQRSIGRVYGFLRDEPRNRLGALDHLGRSTVLGRLYPRSIWVDSLMMYATTAADIAIAHDDRALLDFALAQPRIFARYLQDPDTGLFRHAWLIAREHPRPRKPVFWLRGNGWVAAALVDLIELAPAEHPERPHIIAIFEHLMYGLSQARRSDGTWSTVVHDPRTYEESSGMALVAYAQAKGARLGILPPAARSQAEQTHRVLTARIETSPSGPRLPGVSLATHPSGRTGYAVVARSNDVDYGIGAYALLTAELMTD